MPQQSVKPIARWNSGRDCWETDQVDLLSGRSVVFSGIFPISGSMRNGVAYEHQMLGRHTNDSGFSSSPLVAMLHTPDTTPGAGNKRIQGRPGPQGLENQILAATSMSTRSSRSGETSQTAPSACTESLEGMPSETLPDESMTTEAATDSSTSTSSLLLMPTPVAQPSGNTPEDHLRKKPGRDRVTDLAIIVENGLLESGGRLLPTPRSNEANGVGEHGTGGADLRTTIDALLPTPNTMEHLPVRTGEARERARYRGDMGGSRRERAGNLRERVVEELLPTPKAGDADFGMPRTSGRPPEKSTHLMTRLEYTLPTPRATRGGSNTELAYLAGGQRTDEHRAQGSVELPEATDWGPYAAAIHRWEQALDRPAPDPTEEGPKGGRRLSAAFVEWMMGLPDGWVTGPELGLSRVAQLKMLGNGVVTQQALLALALAGGKEE